MRDLSIGPSPGRGRGVFADRDFAEGELIESCPALVLDGRYRSVIGSTILNSYHFNWVQGSDVVALALGYGSIYNHSWTPNADWINRIDENTMHFVAQRPIKAGEEILVHYRYAAGQLPGWYDEGREAAETPDQDALTRSPDDPVQAQ